MKRRKYPMNEKVNFLGLTWTSFLENRTKTSAQATDIKPLLFFPSALAAVREHLDVENCSGQSAMCKDTVWRFYLFMYLSVDYRNIND